MLPLIRPRPWSPLSDAEWSALLPHLGLPAPGARRAGRPTADFRARLDAIFQAVTSGLPWSRFTTPLARTDTLHRQFRRLAHAGLWSRLLAAVTARGAPPALRAIAGFLAAAYRRAIRILGLAGILLARRLGMSEALPAPAWLLPDPDLSETVQRLLFRLLRRPPHPGLAEALRHARALLRAAEGRRRIPASLKRR